MSEVRIFQNDTPLDLEYSEYMHLKILNIYNNLLAVRIIQNYTAAVRIFQSDTQLDLEYSENISS